MKLEKLLDSLDGLHAYDIGCIDSGIHDEDLRARCVAEMNRRRSKGQDVSGDIARMMRDLYGTEDVTDFMKWLSDEMEQP